VTSTTPLETDAALLTLADLTTRVGLSVRTVRFWTTRGLVPPPVRRGRTGYYTPEHVARLGLIADLQDYGFTLAAIEDYLARVPDDASVEELALQRTMLAPWVSPGPGVLTRSEIAERAGRELSDADLEVLVSLGILDPVAAPDDGGGEGYRVALPQLAIGVDLLELGFPPEAARAAADVYAEHGRAIAAELHEVFRRQVWPAYRHSDAPPETLRRVVERLRPLSVAALGQAYQVAMDDQQRGSVERRAAGYRPDMAEKKASKENRDNPSLKDPELYEELRDQGNSKEKAARISNAKARSDAGDGPDPSERGGKHPSYEEWTVDELRERAAELDIEGRSSMNKDDLVDALRNH
jgi:DNA-binding transcriptional MerR regulator